MGVVAGRAAAVVAKVQGEAGKSSGGDSKPTPSKPTSITTLLSMLGLSYTLKILSVKYLE